MTKLNHFRCPDCGRLCSVPWDAAWCTHHGQVDPLPAEWVDSDWTRMRPVTRVITENLPQGAFLWYVQELRNNYGYPGNEIPGEDKRHARIAAGPFEKREDAYAFAGRCPKDMPGHAHAFRVLPADLVPVEQKDAWRRNEPRSPGADERLRGA